MDSESAAFELIDDLIVDPPQTMRASKPAEQPLNVWNALIGMVLRPRRTFERMRDDQRSFWGVVVALMIIAAVFMAYATASTRMNSLQAVDVPNGASAAQIQAARSGAQQMVVPAGSTAIFTAMSSVTGVIGSLFSYIFTAALIFGLVLIFGGKASFKLMFPVAVWSSIPLIIRNLVHGAAALATGAPAVSGLGAVLTATEQMNLPLLYTVLNQIDVYFIWSLVLLGIGISVTAGLTRGKSILVIVTYVLISLGLLVGVFYAGQQLFELVNFRGPGGGPVGGPGGISR